MTYASACVTYCSIQTEANSSCTTGLSSGKLSKAALQGLAEQAVSDDLVHLLANTNITEGQ